MEAPHIERERPGTSPMFWGIALFVISEVFLFGTLFWSYYYIRYFSPDWPPRTLHLDTSLAIINTAILLVSSATMYVGVKAIRRGSKGGLAFGLAATAALGAVFLGITSWEWAHEPFRPWTSAYGSVFYTLTGFHALHVFGGVLLLLALFLRTVKGRFSAERHVAVEVGSWYWHFVDLVWLVVFTTLFIVR